MTEAIVQPVGRGTSRVELGAVPAVSERQMRMVLDVSRLLAVPTDIDDLLCRIAEAATVLLDCERASIFLYDERTGELWTKVALESGEIRFPCDRGIAGHCFTRAEVVCVEEPYRDPRFNPEPDRRTGFVTRNLLTAPMMDLDGGPLGAIQAVNKVGGRFGDPDHALIQLLSEQAGVALQRHNLQVQALEMVELRREMDLARATQQALLPRHPPRMPGFQTAAWNCAAAVAGGDCWDLWDMRDGRLGIFLADASGHGMGPALVVAQARTLVRAISEIEPDPHALLARVNGRLVADLEWGRFVTAFLGFLAPDGLLSWSSAGHGPTLFRADPAAPLRELDPPAQPLGVLEHWMEDAPAPVRLRPGGSLALASDGVFEAVDAAGNFFGVGRLRRTLDGCRDGPPARAVAALRAAVDAWQARHPPLDDQTIVVVQRG
jgi:phosphoserine phosphatase